MCYLNFKSRWSTFISMIWASEQIVHGTSSSNMRMAYNKGVLNNVTWSADDDDDGGGGGVVFSPKAFVFRKQFGSIQRMPSQGQLKMIMPLRPCEYKEMQTSNWMDAMLIHNLDLASSDLRGCQGNHLSKCSIQGLDLHSRWWITWNKYQREVMYRQVHQYSGYERSRTGLYTKWSARSPLTWTMCIKQPFTCFPKYRAYNYWEIMYNLSEGMSVKEGR